MRLNVEAIEKLGDTSVHLGEASLIGGVAAILVPEVPLETSVLGIAFVSFLILFGVLIINQIRDKQGES